MYKGAWRLWGCCGKFKKIALRKGCNSAALSLLLILLSIYSESVLAASGSWRDQFGNVYGVYSSGQAVCDARGKAIGIAPYIGSLLYVPQTSTNGFCVLQSNQYPAWNVAYPIYYTLSQAPLPPCSDATLSRMDDGSGTYVCQRGSPATYNDTPVNQISDASCPVRNPIYAGTGVKIQKEIDYSGAGAQPLSLLRTYRSSYLTVPQNGFGELWQHQWQRRLNLTGQTNYVPAIAAQRGNGTFVQFTRNQVGWVATAGARDRLQPVLNTSNVITGWQYTEASTGSIETYDAFGKLLSVKDRNGWITTLSYSDGATPSDIAPSAGLLISVQNQYGRSLNLRYDAQSRITSMSDPGGGITRYAYDANGMLTTVTWPDGNTRQYHYENSQFRWALTGITDEAGVRFGTYAYDAQGRAISTEHAGGVDKAQLQFLGNGQTTVPHLTAVARRLPLNWSTTYSVLRACRLLVLSAERSQKSPVTTIMATFRAVSILTTRKPATPTMRWAGKFSGSRTTVRLTRKPPQGNGTRSNGW